MEENGKIIKNPNVLQIQKGFISGLIWDYFCYIDKPQYVIDNILIRHQIPVTFLKTEFAKEDTDYVFCILKCRKRYTKDLLDKVFPQLHNAMVIQDGQKYLRFCQKVINIVLAYADNNGEIEV